ncbi:MAG: toprim domain-containing protein [Bacillaceae bacterium]|nr:toprim domain-containing protein [Bacillaceae bacterium]
MDRQKVIIVEGKSDKAKLEKLLDEPVKIVSTNGTLSSEKLEELIMLVEHEDVYILVDADEPGNRLRRQLKREIPHARDLYTRKIYREVAATPIEHLVKILSDAHFEINPDYLLEW